MMDASLRQTLVDGARAVGVSLSDEQLARFEKYLDVLLLWNARINLTAVRSPAEIITKHFVDSLAVAPYVPTSARRAVDVGSGPGFPGAVIAIVRPDLEVTLVESNHKKGAFLQTLRRELPLPNLSVLVDRAETLVGKATFDLAMSRATLDVPEWLKLGQQLVHPGGVVLAMEGNEQHALPPGAVRHSYSIANADRAIVVLATSP